MYRKPDGACNNALIVVNEPTLLTAMRPVFTLFKGKCRNYCHSIYCKAVGATCSRVRNDPFGLLLTGGDESCAHIL